VASDERPLDGDGSRPAERIGERYASVVAGGEQHRGGERLAQRRPGLRETVTAPVQQCAARVGAHGADVVIEAGENELGRGIDFFVGNRFRRGCAEALADRLAQALRHGARMVEARLAAGDPEGDRLALA